MAAERAGGYGSAPSFARQVAQQPVGRWPMTPTVSGRDETVATTSNAQAAGSASAWLLRYVRSYPGTLDQVRLVRAFLREALKGCPRADDAVAVGSEL